MVRAFIIQQTTLNAFVALKLWKDNPQVRRLCICTCWLARFDRGFFSQQLAISEIGVSYSFGQGTYPNTPPEKVRGEPWMFILRDVLQYENTLINAADRIGNANRKTSPQLQQ